MKKIEIIVISSILALMSLANLFMHKDILVGLLLFSTWLLAVSYADLKYKEINPWLLILGVITSIYLLVSQQTLLDITRLEVYISIVIAFLIFDSFTNASHKFFKKEIIHQGALPFYTLSLSSLVYWGIETSLSDTWLIPIIIASSYLLRYFCKSLNYWIGLIIFFCLLFISANQSMLEAYFFISAVAFLWDELFFNALNKGAEPSNIQPLLGGADTVFIAVLAMFTGIGFGVMATLIAILLLGIIHLISKMTPYRLPQQIPLIPFISIATLGIYLFL